jgi:hypothetical protein
MSELKNYEIEEYIKQMTCSEITPDTVNRILLYFIEKFSNITLYNSGTRVFRARNVGEEDKSILKNTLNRKNNFWGYGSEGCLGPPANIAIAGRCNKEGYSVLYAAEDMYTALSEIRRGKGNWISIAEIEIISDIKLLDFFFNERDILLEHSKQLYGWLSFLFYIAAQSKDDYINTQTIADCVRNLGYHGIRYSSAMSEGGINLVIFSQENAKPISSGLYQIKGVVYYAEELLPRKNKQRLLPKSITDKFNENEICWFFNQLQDR